MKLTTKPNIALPTAIFTLTESILQLQSNVSLTIKVHFALIAIYCNDCFCNFSIRITVFLNYYEISYSGKISHKIYNYEILDSFRISHQTRSIKSAHQSKTDQWTNGPMEKKILRTYEKKNTLEHWIIGTLEHWNIGTFDIQSA